MSEPDGAGTSDAGKDDAGRDDGWTTPAGWGGPSQPPPSASSGAPGHGRPLYGRPQDDRPQYGAPAYGAPAYGTPQYPPPGQPQYGPQYGQQYGAPGYPPPPGTWGSRPPELKPGVVPLRPLGLGEVLDGAVGVLRRYPRPTLGIAAIIAVITVLLETLVTATALRPFLELDPDALATGSTEAIEGAIGGAVAAGVLTISLAVLSGAVLTGALTSVVGKAVLGQPLSLGEAWAGVRPVLLRLVGLSLLVGLIAGGTLVVGTVVGVLLFALGTGGAVLGVLVVLASVTAAVWLYFRLALAPCALVLERTGVVDSLRRSGVLVKGDWWRVFGILVLVLLIGSFVTLTLQVPFEVLGAGSLGGVVDAERDVLTFRALALSGIGSVVTTTLVSPFTAGARALLYVDRRMRAEGLDVALAAAATARP
ncbi:MAG: Membrane domain of glycerophosphoryl diester phosphodiesterase [Frankiales bacterium]|nr:Membrane domain of glycerophosphoryl diester phosphodiesterase [Frankiales bacterium]